MTVLRNQGVHEVVLTAALVALVAGRARTAAVLAVTAAVVPSLISPYLFLNGLPQWWAPVVAAPLIVLGLRRPADVPPAPRANAVLVTAGVLALHLIPAGGLRMVDAVPRIVAAVMVIAGVAAFLWVATADQRLLIAVVPTLLLGTLYQLDNAGLTGNCCAGPTRCRPWSSRSSWQLGRSSGPGCNSAPAPDRQTAGPATAGPPGKIDRPGRVVRA
ncbi:hypothetical protein V2I01_26320 [Micromonospora sp. BRA006-A]|nr:hypothetical protein [Micromonospora sp. BRA006-A]